MRRWQVAAAALAGTVAILASSGVAMADGHDHGGDHASICTGGDISPGSYDGLVVTGPCSISSGSVTVDGNLVIQPGALLDATTLAGPLIVTGNVFVRREGVLYYGCGPSAPCSGPGTTVEIDRVGGSIIAVGAFAVVIHSVTVKGDVSMVHGGAGLSECGKGLFFDSEGAVIGGDLRIIGIRTCWMGALRNMVGGNLIDIRNQMGDPDGNEVMANSVGGNLVCFDNSPAVHPNDLSTGTPVGVPNTVHGRALGECSPSDISTVVPRSTDRDSD